MNSNHYEISFWLKISLWCSVSSLLVFILIKAKWNSNRCGFHIGDFGRNDISKRYEIFMWKKIYPNLLTPRIELFHLHNSLNISFTAHARLKVIAVIWTEKKIISGDKLSCKHYPKWNEKLGFHQAINDDIWQYLLGNNFPAPVCTFLSSSIAKLSLNIVKIVQLKYQKFLINIAKYLRGLWRIL